MTKAWRQDSNNFLMGIVVIVVIVLLQHCAGKNTVNHRGRGGSDEQESSDSQLLLNKPTDLGVLDGQCLVDTDLQYSSSWPFDSSRMRLLSVPTMPDKAVVVRSNAASLTVDVASMSGSLDRTFSRGKIALNSFNLSRQSVAYAAAMTGGSRLMINQGDVLYSSELKSGAILPSEAGRMGVIFGENALATDACEEIYTVQGKVNGLTKPGFSRYNTSTYQFERARSLRFQSGNIASSLTDFLTTCNLPNGLSLPVSSAAIQFAQYTYDQSSERILVAGLLKSTQAQNAADFDGVFTARFNWDGTVDPDFGDGGVAAYCFPSVNGSPSRPYLAGLQKGDSEWYLGLGVSESANGSAVDVVYLIPANVKPSQKSITQLTTDGRGLRVSSPAKTPTNFYLRDFKFGHAEWILVGDYTTGPLLVPKQKGAFALRAMKIPVPNTFSQDLYQEQDLSFVNTTVDLNRGNIAYHGVVASPTGWLILKEQRSKTWNNCSQIGTASAPVERRYSLVSSLVQFDYKTGGASPSPVATTPQNTATSSAAPAPTVPVAPTLTLTPTSTVTVTPTPFKVTSPAESNALKPFDKFAYQRISSGELTKDTNGLPAVPTVATTLNILTDEQRGQLQASLRSLELPDFACIAPVDAELARVYQSTSFVGDQSFVDSADNALSSWRTAPTASRLGIPPRKSWSEMPGCEFKLTSSVGTKQLTNPEYVFDSENAQNDSRCSLFGLLVAFGSSIPRKYVSIGGSLVEVSPRLTSVFALQQRLTWDQSVVEASYETIRQYFIDQERICITNKLQRALPGELRYNASLYTYKAGEMVIRGAIYRSLFDNGSTSEALLFPIWQKYRPVENAYGGLISKNATFGIIDSDNTKLISTVPVKALPGKAIQALPADSRTISEKIARTTSCEILSEKLGRMKQAAETLACQTSGALPTNCSDVDTRLQAAYQAASACTTAVSKCSSQIEGLLAEKVRCGAGSSVSCSTGNSMTTFVTASLREGCVALTKQSCMLTSGLLTMCQSLLSGGSQ